MIRNAAVPAANFGAGFGWLLIIAGLFFSKTLVWVGIGTFAAVVFFQLVNLPVEYDASYRAEKHLQALGITNYVQQKQVSRVLSAAALTYVAATMQSVMTLFYLLTRFGGVGDD